MNGKLAAFGAACFWTVSALMFERGTRRIGSLSVNILKLALASLFLVALSLVLRGFALPYGASPRTLLLLSVSGLIGFVFGDIFLFSSYPIIGSRIAMLIQASVPPITALIEWVFLGEMMSLKKLCGMALTVGGIALVVMRRGTAKPAGRSEVSSPAGYPLKGIIYAFLGAVGQSVGLILSKAGIGSYDPVAGTQVRIFAGLAGFCILALFMGRLPSVARSYADRKAVGFTAIGSVFGPFLGVTLSMIAVQNTDAGTASTLMALTPILMIPPSVIFLGQKIRITDVAGTLFAVGGTALFFI